MILYLRLAWRNLWRNRRRTLIVVLSVALGLMLMMMYDGMISGFQDAIYGNAVKVLGGNIQIHAPGYTAQESETPLLPLDNDQAVVADALAQPHVLGASRRIVTGGLATSKEGAFAVSIVGMEPDKEKPVNLVTQKVTAGSFLTNELQDNVFIGKGLADAMGVTVGDRFTLAGKGSHDQMRSRTMTVSGIYDIGMADIEKRTVYMSLAEAQDLYGLAGQSTEVVVYMEKLGQEPAAISSLKSALPNTEIMYWADAFPEMASAINAKSSVMQIFSVIIVIIAAIGIINLLLMAIYERTREIGLLGALGMRPRQISVLFVLEGTMMALVGVAAGIVLGLALNATLGVVGIDYSQFSSLTSYTALISGKVYSGLGLENLLSRSVIIIVISFLASLYPAREAALNEPAESLHFV